ncbi:MAG: ABC transporter permease [Acidobacteria bacterium]|nr:ABC transporter permease [Acidobacteriota bacterium]
MLRRLAFLMYPRVFRRQHAEELMQLLAHHAGTVRQRFPLAWPVVFLARAYSDARQSRASEGGGHVVLGREVRWAIRGVRARGWTAVLSVVLVALAASASTLVFASADALIFNRVPLADPARLVRVGNNVPGPVFADLREQTDLFNGVGGYQQPVATFLETPVGLMDVQSAGVTPGTFETLGILPQFGRTFVDADRLHPRPNVVILHFTLAQRLYGDPALAVGQSLEASGEHLDVIGVMPSGFVYPYGNVALWRVVDYVRLPAGSFVIPTARLAPGVSHDHASSALKPRFPTLVSRQSQTVHVVTETFGNIGTSRRALFAVLLGAALCLLIAVCANVVNLELTLEMRRAQAVSIRLALGASRASLVVSAVLEGLFLMAGGLALAAGFCALGASALQSLLPDQLTSYSLQKVAFDSRAWLFLTAVMGVAWIPSTLPAVFHATRSSVTQILKSGGPSATGGRAGRLLRHGIMAAQTGLAVVLLLGGTVYVRAYLERIAVKPGFDTSVVAEVELKMPAHTFTPTSAGVLQRDVIDRLGGHPAVESVAPVTINVPPQPSGVYSYVKGVDDVVQERPELGLWVYFVDPGFFRTAGLAFARGRAFGEQDPPDRVVIGESLARRLWPDADAVGRRLEIGSVAKVTVAGVVPDVKMRPLVSPDGARIESQAVFVPARLEPSLSQPITQRGFIQAKVLVRLSDPDQLDQVLELARSTDVRALFVAELLSTRYDRLHSEVRMAASVMTTFALLAAVIAVAGVFGVMAFLVASQRREFGIRLALGADQRRLQTLVLGTSLKLVGTGTLAGIVAARLVERAAGASLVGITPATPLTYGIIASVVVVVTLAATWGPARRASRIDPTVALRAE